MDYISYLLNHKRWEMGLLVIFVSNNKGHFKFVKRVIQKGGGGGTIILNIKTYWGLSLNLKVFIKEGGWCYLEVSSSRSILSKVAQCAISDRVDVNTCKSHCCFLTRCSKLGTTQNGLTIIHFELLPKLGLSNYYCKSFLSNTWF